MSYEYASIVDSSPDPQIRTNTLPRNTVLKKKGRTGPKAPRKIAPSDIQRTKNNNAIKQRVAAKSAARMSSLSSNLTILEPFIEPKIRARLEAAQQSVDGQIKKSAVRLFQPDAIVADLRDYQLAGLNWMIKMHDQNLGMILGDEMGLGKTLQTISLLAHLKESEGITGPSLIICPLSVMYSWCNELEKWAPSLKYLRFHASSGNDQDILKNFFAQNLMAFDVIITTFEMAKIPTLKGFWNRFYFNYLVLDEGHKIKDMSTGIAMGVRSIHRENALILTGTPLQNNLVELHSLLFFLYPDIFTTSAPFSAAFNLTTNLIDKAKLEQAQKLLKLFMLRRMKVTVEKLMPKKIETKVFCPLSKMQVFWYKALLLRDISSLIRDKDQPTPKGHAKVLNNLIMQLRKCCLHPFLFSGAETDIDSTSLRDLVASSGKLAVLDMLLINLFKKKHRCVLFSQFTGLLDIIQDYCEMRGWNYCRFDGSTPRAQRHFAVTQFNAEDSDKFIFLLSTRCGGCGLNLQTADTCILYDSDWNPQPDLQAMARVHRIGQEKTVHVYRLVSAGTIEERMVERAEKKLYLDQMVNHSRASNEEPKNAISTERLFSTLSFGCQAVFGGGDNKLPTLKDIAMIIDRARSEGFSDGRLVGGTANSTTSFKVDKDFTSTTQLGGTDFKAIRDKYKKANDSAIRALNGISAQWRKMQDEKRKCKNRLLMITNNKAGYGKTLIPVLAANNYDLESGESSIFSRELKSDRRSSSGTKSKTRKSFFDHQDFCQRCGGDGTIILCPRCPIAVHHQCAGVQNAMDFKSCSHHKCWECGKSASSAGGMLFVCQACPKAFCEDCLPTDVKRIIGDCTRFEKLGYISPQSASAVYIHCDENCENVAIKEFGWTPEKKQRQKCPELLDIADEFGDEIDESIEANYDEVNESSPRRRKRAKHESSAQLSPIVTGNENVTSIGTATSSKDQLKPASVISLESIT